MLNTLLDCLCRWLRITIDWSGIGTDDDDVPDPLISREPVAHHPSLWE